MSVVDALLTATRSLAIAGEQAAFGPPVACVYNPLRYAGAAHRRYITAYAKENVRAVFLGMNPGPFGMVQTGIPFGDVRAVTDWLGIADGVEPPERQHPARPVLGFACTRREISGSRLWGLFAERFGTPDRFFAEHFVLNYCPLAFLGDTGRNLTPDKLSGPAMRALLAACDRHLSAAVRRCGPAGWSPSAPTPNGEHAELFPTDSVWSVCSIPAPPVRAPMPAGPSRRPPN